MLLKNQYETLYKIYNYIDLIRVPLLIIYCFLYLTITNASKILPNTFFGSLIKGATFFVGLIAIAYSKPFLNDWLIDQTKWWQLKVHPDSFNFEDYWRTNQERKIYEWNMLQMPDFDKLLDREVIHHMRQGHKVIIWVYDEPVGIYLVGEIMNPPSKTSPSPQMVPFYSREVMGEVSQVVVKVEYDLSNRPLDLKLCRMQQILSKWGTDKGRLEDPNSDKKVKLTKLIGRHKYLHYRVGKIDGFGWVPFRPLTHDVGRQIETISR